MLKINTRNKIAHVADKVVEYSLYGLIFFIPISNAAIEIFAGFAIFGFLVKKIAKPDFEFIEGREFIFLFIFIFFTTMSFTNSGIYIYKSMKGFFGKWFEYILVFLSVQDTLCDRKRMRNALAILLFSASITGVDALTQKFVGLEFLRNKEKCLIGVNASFDHYNDFGTYLTCVLPIFVSLLISIKKRFIKFTLGILLILLISTLLLTFSRGAWLSFIISFIVILILSKRYAILLPVILLFIMSIISIAPLRERFLFSFRLGGGVGDALRFHMWKTCFVIIKQHPIIGNGLNTFMDRFVQYAPRTYPGYAHNCYLQIWVETGIFSLVAFLAFLWIIFHKSINCYFVSRDILLLGIIGAATAFLIHSFFDTTLYSLRLAMLFWYILGLMQNFTSISCPKQDFLMIRK